MLNKEAINKVYNVATGENFSINYLYRAIEKHLQGKHKPIYREAREGDIRNSLADISLAKNLLDYKPHIKFDEGLKVTIEYFKKLYF